MQLKKYIDKLQWKSNENKQKLPCLAQPTTASTSAGLQAVVGTWMRAKVETGVPGLVFDEYTVVAWIAVVLGCFNLFLLTPVCFKVMIAVVLGCFNLFLLTPVCFMVIVRKIHCIFLSIIKKKSI